MDSDVFQSSGLKDERLYLTQPAARSIAAEALGAIGDLRAMEPLLRYTSDPDTNVRRAVSLAISQLHKGTTVNTLISLLRDPDKEVRYYALSGLEKQFQYTSKVKELLTKLSQEDPDSKIRKKASKILRFLKDSKGNKRR